MKEEEINLKELLRCIKRAPAMLVSIAKRKECYLHSYFIFSTFYVKAIIKNIITFMRKKILYSLALLLSLIYFYTFSCQWFRMKKYVWIHSTCVSLSLQQYFKRNLSQAWNFALPLHIFELCSLSVDALATLRRTFNINAVHFLNIVWELLLISRYLSWFWI